MPYILYLRGAYKLLNIKVIKEKSKAVIKISGEIDLYNAQDIKVKITEFIEKNIDNIVLDFDGVRNIDSSGMGVLIYSAYKLKEAGGKLNVVNATERIKKIFDVTKLGDTVEYD